MRIPKYQRHSSGQARVVINGRVFYLGRHNSKASKQRYDAIIAEYLASNRSPTFGVDAAKLTMAHLMLAYMEHARSYYGTEPTSEVHRLKYALRPVNKLYSKLPIEEFSAAQFKAVRQEFIALGQARSSINAQMKRILRMMKWGAAEDMYPASIFESLRLIQGLRLGHTNVREAEPVKPVSDDKITATIPHCSPVVADMIRVQVLVGCRPGELCKLTPGMIDRTKDVWEAKLDRHKTAYRGKERILYIGPQAQAIITPYLKRGDDESLFSPADAVKQLNELRVRTTPMNQGNRRGYGPATRQNLKTRQIGTSYNSQTYGKAVSYACLKAFPYPKKEMSIVEKQAWRDAEWWSPNQLRHAAATKLRKAFGLDAAGVILGHSQLGVTQIYAEQDRKKAAEIQRQIG